MLYFIRHGETDYNTQGLFMGCTDISLNEKGLSQALNAGNTLADIQFHTIYTSPLKRALDTTTLIAKQQLQTPTITIIDDLRERNFGQLEGTERIYSLSEDLDHIEGIETKKQLMLRLDTIMSQLMEESQERSNLMVSHSGVFHCLVHDMGYRTVPTSLAESLPNCQAVLLIK